ncbi:MAG: alpha/beta hydrolase [Xanthobacteraceae bacterium]
MPAIDYEAEYNNRARVPEHPEIFARWARAAEAFRASHSDAELGLAYGKSPREKIDLFWPMAGRSAPFALFIHGGYWRSLEPSAFSHLAAGANAHGIALALAGYDLCPAVTMEAIIEEMRAAAAFLYRRFRRPLVASGHSAGGHLSACLVATDWKKYGEDLPAVLVPAGLSISGLFELSPLMHTSMNQDLRIDAENVARISPQTWSVAPGRTFDAWVGGDESSEFLRESRDIVAEWGRKGVATRYVEVARANHFTVLDPLADPQSTMTKRLVELVGASA